MKLFLKKDIPSFIFVASLTVLGVFLTLILLGNQNDKEQLGAIIGIIGSFCLAASMYLTILKRNKTTSE
ncbi:MAG: hypothetical protein GKR88_07755 [Flavobacteriaceae bacterium]|nr:MAG: hypothetical protein GKR88_07755 [Flavobacteriaceae bacterium]